MGETNALRRPDARPPLHVAIVMPGLGAGGTEHVVNVLANEWTRRGWRVTVLTFEQPDTPSYYRFDPAVEIRRLGLPPKPQRLGPAAMGSVRRVQALRTALTDVKPGLVISFLTRTNVLTLLATRYLGVPVVVSERNNPALQDTGPIWRALRRHLYPKAFGLVTMTAGALEFFPAALRRRSWVIPNSVDLPADRQRKRLGNTLTAVGRLVPQKGFDLLIEAFSRIAPEFPDWSLVIWGEGPERAALEAQRAALRLEGRVRMPGITGEPGLWVETADVFVLSSRFEGWGIVLLEAMAADLPVVSFDCQWGPRDMLTDSVHGLLVERENVEALAGALRRVLGDGALRARLGEAAGRHARTFTPERNVDQWDAVAFAAITARDDGSM
ncbi:glycosyltransferase family 4 protein [Aureimonas sp. AU12]|uniref:glycosyltransferase family 4 protein n=1 Tax=Aureimonas sp. AU12 TaxID=1638161 RepID=UPI000781D576|nr:glycosyltransferase family 4 protein [Aureimonas sp. AU12]